MADHPRYLFGSDGMVEYIYNIGPGSMGVLAVCIDLLGMSGIVDGGSWSQPVTIRASPEDAQALKELLVGQGLVNCWVEMVKEQPKLH